MKIKNKIIVGITGKMGSGKDAVARQLTQHHGFVVMRFADTLKAAACAVFNWELSDLEDLTFKTTIDPFWGESPRVLLQKLGTEVGRHINPDIWVKSLERRLMNHSDTRFVIPDVRFVNEADAVSTWGGFVVKIVRPGWVVPGSTTSQTQHTSETALDTYENWFAQINNDKDLNALNDEARRLGAIITGIVSTPK